MGSTLIVDEIQGATTTANVKFPAGSVVQTVIYEPNPSITFLSEFNFNYWYMDKYR